MMGSNPEVDNVTEVSGEWNQDLRNFPTLPDFIAQPGVNTNIIDVDHASPSTICHLFFDDFIISHIKVL